MWNGFDAGTGWFYTGSGVKQQDSTIESCPLEKTMLGPIVTQLQRLMERKASAVQRSFLKMSQELEDLGNEMMKLSGEEHRTALARQKEIRQEQQNVAENINVWRDFAREAVLQGTEERMREYIGRIKQQADDDLMEELDDLLFLLDNPDEILKRLEEAERKADSGTPVDRLIERAMTVYDMRQESDQARREAAFEFANRQGMMQTEGVLEQLERFTDDDDRFVRETALLTLIQMHRLRAMRLADIRQSHESVKRLTLIKHPAVIPSLIEILENPRKGYLDRDGGVVEVDNVRSRQIALLRLVEWHTPEAQKAIYMRRFDQNSDIVNFVEKALEMFPGEWNGVLPDRNDPVT